MRHWDPEIKINNPIHRVTVIIVDVFLKLFYRFGLIFNLWQVSHSSLKEIHPKYILVVALEPLGDVVLSTPVYASLKSKYPCSRITVMVGKWASEILSNNPYIDEIFVNNIPWAFSDSIFSIRGFFGHFRYIFFSYLKVYRMIKRSSYDLGIDLRGDLRNILFFLVLPGLKNTLSFERSGGSYFLTKAVNFHQNENILSKNNRLLIELGVEDNLSQISVFPSDKDFLEASSLLERHGVLEGDQFCIIHPGAGRWVRLWDSGRYAEIADLISERLKLKVIFTGSNKDGKLVKKISKFSRNKPLDLSGCLSLLELAVVLKKCRFLICPDTSVMHIAAAFLIPTIALYGPDRPEHTKPFTGNIRVVDKKFPCSPCLQKRCNLDKNGYSGCMDAITVNDITREISILSGVDFV
jgi:ADP-heptose:LPS heptosyltransferase